MPVEINVKKEDVEEIESDRSDNKIPEEALDERIEAGFGVNLRRLRAEQLVKNAYIETDEGQRAVEKTELLLTQQEKDIAKTIVNG